MKNFEKFKVIEILKNPDGYSVETLDRAMKAVLEMTENGAWWYSY